MALPAAFLTALTRLFPQERLFTTKADCLAYGYDNSRVQITPEAVIFPVNHDEVLQLVHLCNQQLVPFVARGRGTGTVGASVPALHGIVLSFERMNQILEFNPSDRFIRVQPGITNEEVQQAVAANGFFWPPDPTSAAVCTVGGNLAHNSAGPRAIKFGTPRENTLGLRVVTGSGEEMRTGSFTTKSVVGYDLTRLLIGSEGTLGVITEATLKLTPKPEAIATLQAVYRDIESATEAIVALMTRPHLPYTLEFIDRNAINMVRNFSPIPLPENAGAMLMIEMDGSKGEIETLAQHTAEIANNSGCIRVEQAKSSEEVQQLWQTRKALSPALRNIAPKKLNEDIVVPVSNIPVLIQSLDRLSEKYRIPIVNFGHAGNGNIHVNLLFDPDNAEQARQAHECLAEIFTLVLKLRGSLSGEHGIGTAKQPYIQQELGSTAIALMKKIKQQFDPNNLLNAGKIFPIG